MDRGVRRVDDVAGVGGHRQPGRGGRGRGSGRGAGRRERRERGRDERARDEARASDRPAVDAGGRRCGARRRRTAAVAARRPRRGLRRRGSRRARQLARSARSGRAAARPAATCPGSGRRSRASPPTPRGAGRRSRASGRSRAQLVAIDRRDRQLRREDRPLVLGQRELRERELVVPAEQLPIRLAERVADRRGEVDPADQRERRVEDQRDRQVEPAPAVEPEIPRRDAVAIGAGVSGSSPSSSSQRSTSAGRTGAPGSADRHGGQSTVAIRSRPSGERRREPAARSPPGRAAAVWRAPAATDAGRPDAGRSVRAVRSPDGDRDPLLGGAAFAAARRAAAVRGRADSIEAPLLTIRLGKSVALHVAGDLHVAADPRRRAG